MAEKITLEKLLDMAVEEVRLRKNKQDRIDEIAAEIEILNKDADSLNRDSFFQIGAITAFNEIVHERLKKEGLE